MGNITDRHEKMRRRITLKGLFYAAISSASFGFSPVFSIALIAAGLTHFDILSYRWLTAAAVLVIYAFIKGKTLRFNSFSEAWKTVLLSALRALTSITLLIGYANIATGIASTINFMHKVTITGYMKLIVAAIPLEMLTYPIRSVTDVRARSALRRNIFHASSKELRRSDFFFENAYIINTSPAISHRYESISKSLSPAAIRAKLKSGEKPNDIDEITA